jgi:hypothetical protein
MKRFRQATLAVLGAAALCAVVSVPAVAEVNLPELTGEAGVKATGGKAVFEASTVEQITCKSSSGEVGATGKRVGDFKTTFKECTSLLGKCTSSGEGSGELLVLGEYHLVRLKSGEAGVWYVLNGTPAKFECGNDKVELKGGFLSKVTPVETKTVKLEVELKKKSAKAQSITEFESNSGEKVKAEGIKASVNGGSFSAASLESSEDKLTVSPEDEIVKTK